MPGGVVPLEMDRPMGPRQWCPVWCMMDPPASLAMFDENGGSRPNTSSYRDCVPGGLVPHDPLVPCGRGRDDGNYGGRTVNPLHSRRALQRHDGIRNPTPAHCALRADATAPLARPCGPSDPYCDSWCLQPLDDDWKGWPSRDVKTHRWS